MLMAAIDARDERVEEIRLYGVLVPAADCRCLKVMADQPVGKTYMDVPKSKAQRRAVELAQDALAQMRVWNRQQ